jgi:hypothetical protein
VSATQSVSSVVRQAIPVLVLPLTVIATGWASAPWLRAYPSSVLAVPLFGAAVLSVLVPVLAERFGASRLWQSALIDVLAWLAYSLLVVLHKPEGFGDLVHGLVNGPAQILSFALPLVSPRTLLVAPVTLCWLSGVVAGECLARRWYTPVPYAGWLVTFGLCYLGTERAAVSNDQNTLWYDTVLGIGLLVTLLLLRLAQSWVRQDLSAQSTQADSVLPLRGLATGVVITVLVGLIAIGFARSPAMSGRSTTPERVPSVQTSVPLTPISLIAGLRPADPSAAGSPVFSVQVDRASPNYFSVANLDYYDGDGWSFQRTFRPSGGVIPADLDSSLDVSGPPITQEYRIDGDALTHAPWMPYLYRPQRVSGTQINVDPGSGMIVPIRSLRWGDTFQVRSKASDASFAALGPGALPATSTPPIDLSIPGSLRAALSDVVMSMAPEVGVPTSQPIRYLQALLADLHANYTLARPKPAVRAPTPSMSAGPSPAASPPHTGGTGFADVLASALGPYRSATPEQYATLYTMVARELGVPARIVTGFRVPLRPHTTSLAPGYYPVTTADAWTWVQIPIRGAGWMDVDPSPGSYATATGQQVGAAATPTPTTAPPTRNALVTPTAGGHAVAAKSAVQHGRSSSSMGKIVVALLITAAVLVVILLLLLLRKQVRVRRRRRVRDPRRRLLNAWRESLDMLTESGLPDLTTLTNAEVAAATKEQFGSESGAIADSLGQVANAVVFSTSVSVAADDADAAWRSQQRLRTLVRRRLPLRRRIAARLRYHRAPRARPILSPASWTAAARAAAQLDRRRRRYAGRRRAS